MPVVALVFGGLNFSSKFFLLADVPEGYEGSLSDYAALKAAGVPVLGYGEFITQTVNFIILAFIIFLMVKLANRLIEKKPAAPDRKSKRLNSSLYCAFSMPSSTCTKTTHLHN